MSPEFVQSIQFEDVEINLEKSNIFSLGLTFLQVVCLKDEEEIKNMNNQEVGEELIEEVLSDVNNEKIKKMMKKMLDFDVEKRCSIEDINEMLNSF